MKRRYSVFLANVGSCFDRYCPAYGRAYSVNELLDRIEAIDGLDGVDLVAVPEVMDAAATLQREIGTRNLETVSVATDIFTKEIWKRGSFSSTDVSVRRAAVDHAKEVMDLTDSLGSDLLTIWPGQDGHDYLFQSDYIQARQWFMESVAELCDYKPQMTVGLEYKLKEPRTHSMVSTVGTTILMAQGTGRDNCKVILDYGHALMGYENVAESVAILKQFGDRLCHVHINDNYRLWDDDMIVGSIRTHEFLEFLFWLDRTGYDGWLTIDQFPYREDGQQAVEESVKWLRYLESRLETDAAGEIEGVIARHDSVQSSRLMRALIGGRR